MTRRGHLSIRRVRPTLAEGATSTLAGPGPPGLGQEVTRLVLAWAFGVLGVHRVELEVLAGKSRAIGCYRACGFGQECVRREAELHPDGWKDFILMAVLQPDYMPPGRSG